MKEKNSLKFNNNIFYIAHFAWNLKSMYKSLIKLCISKNIQQYARRVIRTISTRVYGKHAPSLRKAFVTKMYILQGLRLPMIVILSRYHHTHNHCVDPKNVENNV